MVPVRFEIPSLKSDVFRLRIRHWCHITIANPHRRPKSAKSSPLETEACRY
jgi:hypothetical protein